MLEDGVDGSEVLGNGNEVFGDGHLDTLQEGVGEKARPFGLGCFRALTRLKTNDDTTGEDELLMMMRISLLAIAMVFFSKCVVVSFL